MLNYISLNVVASAPSKQPQNNWDVTSSQLTEFWFSITPYFDQSMQDPVEQNLSEDVQVDVQLWHQGLLSQLPEYQVW